MKIKHCSQRTLLDILKFLTEFPIMKRQQQQIYTICALPWTLILKVNLIYLFISTFAFA